MIIDLSGVEVKSGKYLREGKHLVKIDVVKVAEDGSYFEVKFMDKNGSEHNERYWLKDSVMWRVKLLADAAGIDGDKLDLNDLLGRYLYIVLKRDEYEDKNGVLKSYIGVAGHEKSKIKKVDENARKKGVEVIMSGSASNNDELDIDEDIPF